MPQYLLERETSTISMFITLCLELITGGSMQEEGWLRGTAVECRSLTGEHSLSYARHVADG